MCEKCNPKTSEYIYNTEENQYYLRVENYNWDEYYDRYDYTNIAIDYCPWCGEKLVESINE